MIGMPASTAAHMPTRNARRTIARIARAEGLRRERRHGRDQPEPEHECGKQHRVAERSGGDRADRQDGRSAARSLVIIAIWPSWVSASGSASLIVSSDFVAPNIGRLRIRNAWPEGGVHWRNYSDCCAAR